MTKNGLLFLTILLEGYVVLACELIAIRSLVPFVGSGTEVIAIVISAVLLPLAVGYHYGGRRFQRQKRKGRRILSVRQILLHNLLNAMIPLGFGLSYPIQELFFGALNFIGVTHHIPQTALFCLIFLVFPVFLLAQTIPLLSNYFSSQHLSAITGKMLFFSTLGSFAGSVFSTIVLMMLIGVHYTLVFTIGLLVLVVLLLTRRWWKFDNVIALTVLGIVALLNSEAMLSSLNIVSNNQYSMVKIFDQPEQERVLMDINRSNSSAYSPNPQKRFAYLQWVENNLINPAIESDEPKEILVLGAGGFTIGVDDKVNHYTFVDIDPSLKAVSEQYLLPEPLGENKRFVAESARVFLTRDTQRYDIIILDVYSHVLSIPQEATTVEFLQLCKQHLEPGGILMANIISSPRFADPFSRRYQNTFRSVFPYFTTQLVKPLKPWSKQENELHNVLYIYHHLPQVPVDEVVYTDNLNTYSLDR